MIDKLNDQVYAKQPRRMVTARWFNIKFCKREVRIKKN